MACRTRALWWIRKLIHDDDLPRVQAGSEDLLNVEFESDGIGCPFQDEGFTHPLPRKCGHQGGIDSIVAWHRAFGSLSSGSVGIQRRDSHMGTRLIHKHQILAR